MDSQNQFMLSKDTKYGLPDRPRGALSEQKVLHEQKVSTLKQAAFLTDGMTHKTTPTPCLQTVLLLRSEVKSHLSISGCISASGSKYEEFGFYCHKCGSLLAGKQSPKQGRPKIFFK